MMNAPPTPCTTRNTMIDASFQASPQASEPSTKTTKPISYIRTRPNMSPSRPTCVASSVMTSRKLMMTQTTAESATCSPALDLRQGEDDDGGVHRGHQHA